MTVVHVSITCAADYVSAGSRPGGPHRPAAAPAGGRRPRGRRPHPRRPKRRPLLSRAAQRTRCAPSWRRIPTTAWARGRPTSRGTSRRSSIRGDRAAGGRQWARRRRTGRSGSGTTASTGSSAAERSRYPDLAEDNHYIDQPYGPEEQLPPIEGPRRRGARTLRDTEARSEPDKPVVLRSARARRSRAAPRAAGVRREVQGPVRRRLQRVAGVRVLARDREEGSSPRGPRLAPDQPR